MNSIDTSTWTENVTFDELSVGQSAQLQRTLTLADIQAFAAVSGDTNPAHLDPEYANDTLFHGVIAHGMWGGSLISALLGTEFPGPGTIYIHQDLDFLKPVRVGDSLTVKVTVLSKEAEHHRVELACEVTNQTGHAVLRGTARVIAPTQKVRRPRVNAPSIQLIDPESRFKALLSLVEGLPAVRCGVVHPCDAESLSGALDAAAHGLILPVLIGPEEKIRATLGGFVAVGHGHNFDALQGELRSLHTDELLHAVLSQPQLRTGRRMSHVFRFDVPLYPKPLMVTDAALNISPSLRDKADIIQNAIDLAHSLGVPQPKVAILAAVETVNPDMPSTLEAAALCKMADRGQIKGGLLDGPLAFDNAISLEAARIKHIESCVAGDADILVAPDLEAANMLAKQLEYLAGASGAGLVVGARLPIALTSRADGPRTRVASAVLALIAAHQARKDPIRRAQLEGKA